MSFFHIFDWKLPNKKASPMKNEKRKKVPERFINLHELPEASRNENVKVPRIAELLRLRLDKIKLYLIHKNRQKQLFCIEIFFVFLPQLCYGIVMKID